MPADMRPVRGVDEERTTGWFFDFWEDWTPLFQRCNWYDFSFVRLTAEYSPHSERAEVEIALLGFGLRVSYVYADNWGRQMREEIEELQSGDRVVMSLPEFKALMGRGGESTDALNDYLERVLNEGRPPEEKG